MHEKAGENSTSSFKAESQFLVLFSYIWDIILQEGCVGLVGAKSGEVNSWAEIKINLINQ